ncbi:ankyrin repeat domain-containing protein SOWAHC isoform X2 [Larimichthys crocea]|uniref:ankyrin repeat domain-containing protein SOWAHC isoform X2 n=1 Tax=Larimichthys crocea TaxID=215358 RepID=UPI000F5F7341|nr:ankyrin repeat domain-containing protein SOWAHC-like isoform X2 [Larimichthys crocea]
MDQDFPESSLNNELQTESLRDLKLDRTLNQSPESLKLVQDLYSGLDQVLDKDSAQDEAEPDPGPSEPPQDQLEEQGLDQNPTEHDGDRGRPAQDQDLIRAVHSQDLDRVSHQDQDQDLTTDSNQGVGGDGVPALVITQAEEALGLEPAGPVGRAVTPADPVMDPGLSSSSDGGDMTCSDLLSLRSDSFSLMSEPAVCRTSEDDDSRSVTASSVMTALHWAAKQGRQDSVDLMLRSGADVNVRSGYTALHLASIHGHQHVVHSLINTYNAKTTIRDYHGKTANQYASCSDNKPEAQPGGWSHHGRQSQRSVLPSLLARSRSPGQLTLDFVTTPQSHDGLDF